MRWKLLLPVILAPLALASLVWAAWTYYITRDEIPVVTTFGQLCEVRAIEIEGRWRVHVGREARSCAAGGGMLVYVLVEGAYDAQSQPPASPTGSPFRVDCYPAGETPPAPLTGTESLSSNKPPPGTLWTLFTHRIAPERPGRWRLAAVLPSGAVVRRSVLEASPDTFHPWIRWGEWSRNLCSQGPTASGQLPHGFRFYLGKTSPLEKLPVLFPAVPDPDFVIRSDGEWIELSANSPVTQAAGEYSFLVRFWRNGEPWSPNVPPPNGLRGRLGGVHTKESVMLKLGEILDAGAHSQDRFEAQLLDCAGGWGTAENGLDLTWLSGIRRWSANSSLDTLGTAANRISNRVEFRLER